MGVQHLKIARFVVVVVVVAGCIVVMHKGGTGSRNFRDIRNFLHLRKFRNLMQFANAKYVTWSNLVHNERGRC